MSAKTLRVWPFLVKVCWGCGKTYFSFLFKIRACEQLCLFWDVLIRNGQPRQLVTLVDGSSREHQTRIYDCNHLTQGSPESSGIVPMLRQLASKCLGVVASLPCLVVLQGCWP